MLKMKAGGFGGGALFVLITILLFGVIRVSAQEESENNNEQNQCSNVGNCCHGVPGVPGIPGIPGNPGIQGPIAPTGMGNTGDSGPIQITPRVAFSVSRTSSLGPVYVGNHAVIYDKVYTNIGQHYNQSSGKFTCPVNGVYYFTMTAMSDDSHDLQTCFMRSATQLTCARVDHSSHSYDTCTNNIILDIQQGDEIWVRLYTGHALYGSSNYEYTTFSGYLIYPK